jgi:hypothetical protein
MISFEINESIQVEQPRQKLGGFTQQTKQATMTKLMLSNIQVDGLQGFCRIL